MFLVLGLTLGIAQWFALRSYIHKASLWILATAIGFPLGLGIGMAVGFTTSQSISDYSQANAILFVTWSIGFVFGPGIAQWLVLRRQVKRASWWILANAIGLFIGFLPVVNVGGYKIGVVEAGVTGALVGGIYGTITGIVLVWLLRNPLFQRAALPQSTSNNVTIEATRPSPAGVFGFLRSEQKRREVASRLQRIQSEISGLQSEYETLSKRNQAPLARRDQLEVEISRLVQLDAANLRLRVDDDRKKASRLSNEQLHERGKRLDQELQNLERTRSEAQGQLENTVRDMEALKAKRRETEGRLQQLERDDPANMGVVLRHLRENWEGMSETELEKQIVKSDIERLYREKLLLRYSIQNASEKAEELNRVIKDPIAEAILLLEKHTLERENLERDFQRDLSRHSEINTLLQQLQPEYRELEQLNRNLTEATERERRIARVITWAISISLLIFIVIAMVVGINAYQTHQKEQIYQQALIALEVGHWETARLELRELSQLDSNYKDVQTLMLESYYRPAVRALEAGQWETARVELQQLLSIDNYYKDAQILLLESYYRPTIIAIQTGQWDNAAETIIQLNELESAYKDIPELIATQPELRQALASRYGQLWLKGDVTTYDITSVAIPSVLNPIVEIFHRAPYICVGYCGDYDGWFTLLKLEVTEGNLLLYGKVEFSFSSEYDGVNSFPYYPITLKVGNYSWQCEYCSTGFAYGQRIPLNTPEIGYFTFNIETPIPASTLQEIWTLEAPWLPSQYVQFKIR